MERALHYQNISEIIYDDLKFSPKDRWSINKIEKYVNPF